MGYGVNAQNWFPSVDQVGTEYDLPPLLESFRDLKSDFSIIQNLTNRHRISPHAGTTNFLTCANMKQVPGQFTNSVSCDQIAAEVLGQDTRYSSLAIASGFRNNDGHGGASIHQQRDRMLAELVSTFLTKLKETKEVDGSSLLDHSLVAYGSNLRQGHNMSNGPERSWIQLNSLASIGMARQSATGHSGNQNRA